jgi:type II secretory pathway pseudopilin PulG
MKTVKPLHGKNQGFTLLEALFASMLIGLAVAALVSSSGAFTVYNAAGLDLSTAEFLIEEVRERTAPEIFTTLDGYDGSYNPPSDADGTQMTEFAAYTQNVTVEYVNPANLAQVVTSGTTDFRRITVAITKNGQAITSASWIRAKY